MENNSNSNKISYDINDIQNIIMNNGKIEFELKPKEKAKAIEEKKPKKEDDKKILHQKRKHLVSDWYKNYFGLKRRVNEREISEDDLQCQIQWQIERIEAMINEDITQEHLKELFEYGIIVNMHIISEQFKFPNDIRDQLSAYTGVVIGEFNKYKNETCKIILEETREFVEDNFEYAFIIADRKSVLKTNEDVRKHYESNLESERMLRDIHRTEMMDEENITKSWEKSTEQMIQSWMISN